MNRMNDDWEDTSCEAEGYVPANLPDDDPWEDE